MRLLTVDLLKARSTMRHFDAERVAPIRSLLATIDASDHRATPELSALRATLNDEVLQGASDAGKWHMWGRHYDRTFGGALAREERSNFRDECLQVCACGISMI